jgi:alpha-tubulin suppressor-like RCC1 family protein
MVQTQERARAALMGRLLIVAVLVLALVAAAGSGRAGTARDSAMVSATAIAAGGYYTCALTSSGGVKCWGLRYGARPVDVAGLSSGVTAIAGGSFHSCALTSTGGVKCWGSNFYGQLGDGKKSNGDTPVDVSGLSSGVAAIGVGGGHSCALTTAGGVKCWGFNRLGELGDGTTTDRWTPVDVSGLSNGVTAIAVGGYHTCALTGAGGVKCWGEGGEVGDGTTIDRLTPVDVAALRSGVAAITAGSHHSCALTTAGGVKCWGANGGGQLGDGPGGSRSTPVDVSGLNSGAVAISAGELHSCALMNTGGVKCWGLNAFGQLGEGTPPEPSTPVDVSGLSSGVTAISAGAEHNCALASTGGVTCWGRNSWGQLGDGTTVNRRSPVAVIGLGASEATLAIVSRSVAVTPTRIAAVKVLCGAQADCRGTLTLTASKNGKELGSRTFAIPAARMQAVKVKLTASAFTLLVRVKRLSTEVGISYEQPAGGSTAATRTITLTAPKPVKR